MSWDERKHRAARFAQRGTVNIPSKDIGRMTLVPTNIMQVSDELIWQELNVEGALEDVKADVWWEGKPNKTTDPLGLVLSSNPFPTISVSRPAPWDKSPYDRRPIKPSDTSLSRRDGQSELSVTLIHRGYNTPTSILLKLSGLYGEPDPDGNATLSDLLQRNSLHYGLKRALEPQSLNLTALTGYNLTQVGDYERFLTGISRLRGNLSVETEIIYPESPDTEERFNAALVEMIDLQISLNSIPRQLRARSEDMITQLPKGVREGLFASSDEVWDWYLKFMKQGSQSSGVKAIISTTIQRISNLLRLSSRNR